MKKPIAGGIWWKTTSPKSRNFVASQRVTIKPITATQPTGTLSRRSLHQGECPQALDTGLPQIAHNQLYSSLSPLEQVSAMFAEYVCGEDFSDDRRFKKLNWTPDYCVWEFKTDEVRIFGWIPEKDTFVCCFGDCANTVKLLGSYGKYLAQTTNVRRQMDLNEPKYITGKDYVDVISIKN